jgi:hypothetical protein
MVQVEHIQIMQIGDVKAKTTAQAQVDCRAVRDGTISISPSGGSWMRIKESVAAQVTNLNTTFSKTGVGGSTTTATTALDYSNFFFNGIPDGKYALGTSSIWDTIVDTLANLVDFLIGIMTYFIRITIVGFVSLFDRFLNNTIVSITDTKTSLEETGLNSTTADDPNSENRYITIESILFNQLELFDVDIFSN